jgi:hypothetical protein
LLPTFRITQGSFYCTIVPRRWQLHTNREAVTTLIDY